MLGINDSRINTYANHLIIIFILTMPLLISVRRLSLFLLILLFLLRGRIVFYVSEAIKDPIVKALSLYFIVHVIWLLGTDDYANGKSTVHNAKFLLIPLLFSSFIDRRYIPWMKIAFFIGMFASILVSFGIFLEILPPMPHYGDQGVPSDPTPVYHRTHYGFMLAISSVLSLHQFIVSDRKAVKFLMVLFFIAASVNIFITGGRLGYVLYAVNLVVLLILLFKNITYKSVVILMVTVGLVFSLSYHLSPTLKSRVEQTVVSISSVVEKKDYANSIGGRIGILDYSSDLVRKYWLLGLGTGDQTKAIMNEIRNKDKNLANFFQELGHPHNEYLSALLQFGVIGLLLFINIPVRMFFYNGASKEEEHILKILSIGIVCFTFVDILVLGLGMLFVVVVLVSTSLKYYVTDNVIYNRFSLKQAMYYLLTIALFYLMQLVVP